MKVTLLQDNMNELVPIYMHIDDYFVRNVLVPTPLDDFYCAIINAMIRHVIMDILSFPCTPYSSEILHVIGLSLAIVVSLIIGVN